MTGETRTQPNPKHLEFVANQLGLTGAKTRPTPGVLSHRATMDATPLLTADDARLYRSCVGALMCYVLDRADAQLEVSILGTYLRAPTSGTMEALRRVTRYLLGTQNAYVKLRIWNDDPITVELVGYSDSDWAGDPSSRKSQSSGHVESDGCPLTSFSSKTELCGDEQRNGRVLRDVLDCGGTVILQNDSGALWIQSEHDTLLRLSGCAGCCAESWIWEKSRHWH